MARPDRAAGLYGAINAISDRLDPLIRRFALNRPSQLISRTDSITAVQLSRKSGKRHTRETPPSAGSMRSSAS
jgi:hypothetical protein